MPLPGLTDIHASTPHCLLQYGDVKDIIILKDKMSDLSRGCAFVSYSTVEEAERAITRLDKSIHLPGALQPMEVARDICARL